MIKLIHILRETIENSLYISDSPIHGKGLFTKINIPANTQILLVLDFKKHKVNTVLSQHVNHSSNKANAKVIEDGSKLILVTTKDIKANEELTVDYHKLPVIFNRDTTGFIDEALSDIHGEPLYHKTSTQRGLDIIKSNLLKSGPVPSGDYLNYDKRLANTKHQTAISLTRDKNWKPNHTIGLGLETPLEDTDMVFVLDKNKLKTKYKIEPFNYSGIEPDYKHHTKNDELEERVMTDKIYPLRKYLIDILYKGKDPKIQKQIDNYLNL